MKRNEYENIKNYSYTDYCDYLQKKYGIGKYDYMTKSWNKNARCTRTSEGLLAHHKYESHAIMLSDKKFAMQQPFEWQHAINIVYCDYLEHLLLHILICEITDPDYETSGAVGIGGVVNFLIPELNDFYSGWQTKQSWRINCHNIIKDDKDVYLELVKRFKANCSVHPLYNEQQLYTSYNEQFGVWLSKNNLELYNEIKNI